MYLCVAEYGAVRTGSDSDWVNTFIFMTLKLMLAVAFVVTVFAGATFAQSVDITAKKVTYTRKKPIADHKKTFEITYPKIKAKTPAISRKIEAILSYEKAFDFTLAEELGEMQWLEEASYEVGYNLHKALSVSLSIQGSGAYPSGMTKYVVVNTATGTRATPATEFVNAPMLAAKINKMLQMEVAEAVKELKADKENQDIVPEELFRGKRFRAADLSNFSLGVHGVTFHYDYNFVHALQALEPNGEFLLAWSQMAPYLKRGGLLAPIANYIIKYK